MMKFSQFIKIFVVLLAIASFSPIAAQDSLSEDVGSPKQEAEEFNAKEMILEHLSDSYVWHITDIGEKSISIPLPVILYSENSGFNVFLSSKFEHGHESYNGFYISQTGENAGKVVEKNTSGEEVRPIDISITHTALALMINTAILIILIMTVAKFYKKQEKDENYIAPKGFVGGMEMFIMNIVEDVIRPSIGPEYKKYTPYLLTAFFFIFINNVMGLIPIFPAGANTTGNIAITLVLALFTFVIVNINGSKEYWKENFNPDVPLLLKPLMVIIEFVGLFIKPFSLMVRLFANILAGHSIVLGFTSLIFVTVALGTAMNSTMTVTSILLTVFILFVELLVAYIQAYVFTILSSVYIGLARVQPHNHK